MNDKEVKNQALGDLIRSRRLARGLARVEVADAANVHVSYLARVENGEYHSPAPEYLQAFSRVLDIPIEDLYSLCGYEVSDELPTLSPYLRAKYSLPPEAIADIERYFDMLRNYYGIPKDQPVFPPKPKEVAEPENQSNEDERRAA